jgi:GT2 family glycosyltransferase
LTGEPAAFGSAPPDPRSPALATVLIVAYKAYGELHSCLASLERYEPVAPVVVVDHDADALRAAGVEATFPRATYIRRRDNPGFSAGVNRAARSAGPGPILLLNPDCELRGSILGPMLDVLARHPTTGIVGGLVREHDGRVQASARRFPDVTTAFGGRTSWLTRHLPGNPLTRRNLHEVSDGQEAKVDWVTGAFMLIRRDAFDAVGGFDERFFLYWEDADFCRRAAAAGWTTMYAPVVEVTHLTARASRHAPLRSLVAFHVSAWRYYWKHGGWLARLLSPLAAAGLALRFAIRWLTRRAD